MQAFLLALFFWAGLAASASAQELVLNINDNGYDPIPAGGTIPYSVRIDNSGNTNSAATTIEFTVPADAEFTGLTGALQNCTPASATGGATVSCDIPALAPQQSISSVFNLVPFKEGTTELLAQIAGGPSGQQTTTVSLGADLEVKLTGDTAKTAGEITNFTATVTNNGPYPSNGVTLTLDIAPGLSNDVSLPPGCSTAGNAITCDVSGPIEVGQQVSFPFSTQIITENASTITIPAALQNADPLDPVNDNDNANHSIAVAAGTDVSIGKSRSPAGLLLVGSDVQFTLAPRYAGTPPSTASISDELPPEYEYILPIETGPGWTCAAPDGQSLTCDYSDAAPGAVYTAPIVINAKAVAVGDEIINTAVISSPQDVRGDNNTGSDNPAFIREPYVDLVARKSGPPRGLVTVGNTYDFRLGTRNDGNAPFWGTLRVTDRLPEGMTAQSFTAPAGWVCAPLPAVGTADVVCETDRYTEANPLMPGQASENVVLAIEITQEGRLSNGLNVSSPNYSYPDIDLGNNDTSTGVDSGQGPRVADLRVAKRLVSPGPFASGTEAKFEIEVINNGAADALNVQLDDRLNDIVFASPSDPGASVTATPGLASGLNCNAKPGSGFYSDVSCTIATLPQCQAGVDCPVIEISTLVGDVGSKVNTASAFSLKTPDPDTSNNSSSASYEVTPVTDVTVTKTGAIADGGDVRAGQQLEYVITAEVLRDGRSPAENVTIKDSLPTGVRFVSATPSTGNCTSVPPAGAIIDGSNSLLSCELGTIGNGSQQTVTVIVVPSTAQAIAGATILNKVDVSTTTPEVDPDNNSDRISHNVIPPVLDLLINKTDDPDPVEINTNTTYTLKVTNNGPSAATNVDIIDTFPSQGLSYVSHSVPAGASCTVDGSPGGSLNCRVPFLPAGQSVDLTIQMEATERGRWINKARVESDETRAGYESQTANNNATEDTTVRVRSDLAVTKTVSKSPVDLWEEFTWSVKVASLSGPGLDVSEAVTFTDTLPANMELAGAPTATSGGCTGAVGTRVVQCGLGDIQAGASVDVTIPVRVTDISSDGQVFENEAKANTKSFDGNQSNNTDSDSVIVNATRLSGTIWRDFNDDGTQQSHDTGIGGIAVTAKRLAAPGEPAYSRTVNTGSDGTYDFTLLPPGTYSVSYSGASNYDPGEAIPGDQAGNANGVDRIDNIVLSVPAPGAGYDFTLIPRPEIALTKTAQTPVLQPDGQSWRITYDFRLSNNSEEPIKAVSLEDSLTAGFGTFTTGSPAPGQFSVDPPTLPGTFSYNTGFDGSADSALVTGGPIPAGGTANISVTFLVNPPLPRQGPTLALRNEATLKGVGAYSERPLDDTANASSMIEHEPSVSLTKSATLVKEGASAAPGDLINYTFTVRNTGKTPLFDVTISDPLPDLVWGNNRKPIERLDPGESDSTTFTAHYVLTQEDIEAGGVENTATAEGRWAADGVTNPTVSASDDAAITALAEPGLTVLKEQVATTVADPTQPGETIRYRFTVTNTGNVALNNLVLSDDLPVEADPSGSFNIGTLARAGEPGNSVTFEAVYPVTQDDIDAGKVINTATVDGVFGSGNTPISEDANEVETPLFPDPLMRVTKLPDTPLPSEPKAGDSISWTITIENIGNTRLEIGSITEPLSDTAVSPPAQPVLQPGESTTATATHILTQAEIDGGSVINQVIVSGRVPGSDIPFTDTPSGNDPDTPNENETVTPLPAAPSIALLKVLTSDVSSPLLPGDEIGFDFTIRNTGNVTLSGLVLTDHLAGVVLNDEVLGGLDLAPDAEIKLTGTYLLTKADIEAGGLTNTATVTGDDPRGTEIRDDSGTGFDNDEPTPVELVRNPQIELVKTIASAPTEPVMAGDEITYAFAIHNTGNVELRDIELIDLVGGVTMSGSRATALAVGEVDSTSFTGSYALTQADIDAGGFANSAEASGTGNGPEGTPIKVTDISGTELGNDDPTEFPIDVQPGLSIVKEADDSAIGKPAVLGQVITYSFTVRNTGNVTLSNVTVTDPLLGGDFADNVIASLAPGDARILTAEYAVTQDDIEAGVVINRASVTGDYFDPGTDEPQTMPPVPTEEIAVPLDQKPRLAVVKVADETALTEPALPGQTITYSFTVHNIGNVTVQNVVLTDPLPGLSTGLFDLGAMAPGAEQTVTASYAVTQADIDAGQVINQATVDGEFGDEPVTDLSGPDMTTDEETVVPLVQAAALTLSKSADAADLTDPALPGQQISYSFTVTNTGNVTLRDVVVSDPLPGLSPSSFTIGELAPGASADVGPAVYEITEADIIAGKVENRALASGDYGPPDDPQTVEKPSSNDEGEDGPTVTPVANAASIALVKQLAADVDAESLRLGDEIRWQFAVTNTGNVPLDEVMITETMVDATVSGGPITLAVGETDTTSFTASHVITQSDLDAGEIVNLARVDGVFVDGNGDRYPVTDLSGTDIDNDDPTRTPLSQRPAIDVVKTVDTSALSTPPVAGDVLSYAFTITNTGEITLHDVTITDPMPGLDLTGTAIPSLAPGASNATAYTASYTLTQEDIDGSGAVENQATVSGDYNDPDGNPQQVTDRSGTETGTDQPTRVEITRQAGLELVKSADASAISETAQEGEEITYTFTVTNTGNVTLTDVTIDDPLLGLVLSGAPIASLAPGEVSDAITGLYPITSEDIRTAGRDNTATAVGVWTPDGGTPNEVTSPESSARVELGYPEIALNITIGELRDLNGDGVMGVGDEVWFRFEVTNTGTVPLNDVNIDADSLSLPLSGLTCSPITLAVGESAFLQCTGAAHIITAADAARGEISLTGDATGTSDAGVTVRATSAAATVTDIAAGGLTLEKLAGVETAVIGDVIPYTIRITNSAEGVPVSARLVDTLPEGFAYRAGSARLDGVKVELQESGRRLTLSPLTLSPGQTRVLELEARVGGSVKPGLLVNRVRLLSGLTGADIAPEAEAAVRIMADAVLQCATVLGRVFDDVDQNGQMSRANEERGLPNVRLVAPNGLAITTDEHGRFNVPCAALPRNIGANFMLKLDERTLPAGFRLTTENPRVVRLTPGMITRLDFGATLARLVRIDLAANAFDGATMSPALREGLQKLVTEIRGTTTMLRLTYLLSSDEAEDSARQRLRSVERVLRDLWAREGRYKLNIETLIQRAGAAR